jgi:hypothetical protein
MFSTRTLQMIENTITIGFGKNRDSSYYHQFLAIDELSIFFSFMFRSTEQIYKFKDVIVLEWHLI